MSRIKSKKIICTALPCIVSILGIMAIPVIYFAHTTFSHACAMTFWDFIWSLPSDVSFYGIFNVKCVIGSCFLCTIKNLSH